MKNDESACDKWLSRAEVAYHTATNSRTPPGERGSNMIKAVAAALISMAHRAGEIDTNINACRVALELIEGRG